MGDPHAVAQSHPESARAERRLGRPRSRRPSVDERVQIEGDHAAAPRAIGFGGPVGNDEIAVEEPGGQTGLKGAAAARVVRALCDFDPPFGVRTLAECSVTPLGTVSRVVSFLEEEAPRRRRGTLACRASQPGAGSAGNARHGHVDVVGNDADRTEALCLRRRVGSLAESSMMSWSKAGPRDH